MNDREIHHHIEELIAQESELLGKAVHTAEDRTRIAEIDVQLDKAWDLLRQRRARREFGQDPELAVERPAAVVERYEQ
jgi:hypothetical protein